MGKRPPLWAAALFATGALAFLAWSAFHSPLDEVLVRPLFVPGKPRLEHFTIALEVKDM